MLFRSGRIHPGAKRFSASRQTLQLVRCITHRGVAVRTLLGISVQTGESPEDVPLEDSSRTFDTIEGNYPPIHKLLTDAKKRSNSDAPMCYASDKLERLSASAKAFGPGRMRPKSG